MSATIDEQLNKYLSDAHSIEEQALAQLRMAPDIAGEPRLAEMHRIHLEETEGQERMVRQRLEDRGGTPSRFKEAVMKAGGAGFALFAKFNPDSPGKLAAHSYSYEHLELAGYELLIRVAERAGDEETVSVARAIAAEERTMIERLDGVWDATVDASLAEQDPDDLGRQLAKYLADAHAIEAQSIQLLERGPKLAGDPELERVYAEHLEESRAQQRDLEDCLKRRGSGPSALKDAAMRSGALNWGMFFQAHPDTPGKLAAFAFALEHLEIGGYEQLKRVAARVGDEQTAQTVDRILTQERSAAAAISASFDRAVDASLRAQGVTA